jgi:cold shock CspA family protein
MSLRRFPRRLPEVWEPMNGVIKTGVIKTYDPQKFVGTIESDGMSFLIKRNSMRRGTLLREGLHVSFVSVNLSDGANAQQILPFEDI